MAFALKLPREVARIVASMHDPYLDRVRAEGGTPSCRALEASLLIDRIRAEGGTPSCRAFGEFAYEMDPPHPEYTCEKEGGKIVVTERTMKLSNVSSHPNISVFGSEHGYWCDELVLTINTSWAYGFVEHGGSHGLDERHRPVMFRNVVCD